MLLVLSIIVILLVIKEMVGLDEAEVVVLVVILVVILIVYLYLVID